MRILAIRGRNLASLAGDFAVELDRGALGAAGLFAITGPTGAGKSTLLDALCLALFDAMPRLTDSPAVAVGRRGEAEELLLRSNDVRGILRRGTAEGFAEVDFLGNDGRRYRSRWEVRRARSRAEGRLQAQNLTLTDLASGEILGRTKTEVLEIIQQRLGLSFEQFRRSALLAQGDFAAFLKARANERSELLERITGTEIYGQLSRAAHQRAGEEKQALGELERRLRDFLPLDSEVQGRSRKTAPGMPAGADRNGGKKNRAAEDPRLAPPPGRAGARRGAGGRSGGNGRIHLAAGGTAPAGAGAGGKSAGAAGSGRELHAGGKGHPAKPGRPARPPGKKKRNYKPNATGRKSLWRRLSNSSGRPRPRCSGRHRFCSRRALSISGWRRRMKR